MNDIETIRKKGAWAENKCKYFREKYEATGSPSSLKSSEFYEDIMDICLFALSTQEDRYYGSNKRQYNINQIIEDIGESHDLGKETWSYDEVAKLLRAVIWQ